jgi:tetratricopeptide (TPR) repeat protein
MTMRANSSGYFPNFIGPKMSRCFFILFIIALASLSVAQPKNFTQMEDADEHFDNGNYLFAIEAYKQELKKDPDNLKAKFRLGACYLNTRISREDAISYLEEVSRSPKIDADVWLYLGRAYHLDNQIDKAIESFEKFRAAKPKLGDEVVRYIQQCENAQKFMSRPANVTLQNLGKHVNSTEPDFNPYIDRDEMQLVFTSRRRENVGGKKIEVDGYRNSDIYTSSLVNGHWQDAKNAGRGLNSGLDERVVGMRSDGMEIYVYLDHIEKFGDIYTSVRRDPESEFAKPKPLDQVVNENIESAGCMSEDGTLLIFARRLSAEENSDLYFCRRLPNSKWGLPVRLPGNVNSVFNEDNPFLSEDCKTLYFTSDGHNSMGGYDLFRCTWDESGNTVSNPENLGFPINSTDDDRSICVTPDNRLAYISAYRPNGVGDLDIYRVRFEDKEPVVAIYTGNVFLGDTTAASRPKEYALAVIATNTVTGFEYTFVPHRKSGRFVMALPEGTYEVTCQMKGYQKHSEVLVVTDMGKRNLERDKHITLQKSKPGSQSKSPSK